ncbi:MAG: tetratricopeptide repeat protein [Vampirovibrionales bacterium]
MENTPFARLFGSKSRQAGRRKPWQRAWWKEPKWQVVSILGAAVLLSGLVFSGVLLLDASNSQDYLHQAKQFMEEGKVAWAAKDLEALTEEHPDLYEAWIDLGQCYLELNELEKAEAAFEAAMAIRTKNKGVQHHSQDVLTILAESKLLRLQHRYKEAEGLLLRAYETHPSNRDLKHALWDVYYQWGLWRLENDADPLKALAVLENAQAFVTRYRYDVKLQDAIEVAVNRQYQRLTDTGTSIKERRRFLAHALSKHYSHTLLAKLAEVEAEDKHPQVSLLYLQQAYTLMPRLYALRYSKALEDALKGALIQGNQRQARSLKARLDNLQRQIRIQKTHLPYSVAVGVTALGVKQLNPKTGEWSPKVSVRLQNKGASEVPFTKVKLHLFSGKHTLDTYYERLKTPLTAAKSLGSTQVIQLSDEHHYMVQRLEYGRLSLEVFIAFDESKDAQWYPVGSFTKTVVNRKQFEGQRFPWEGASGAKSSGKAQSTLPTKTI